MRKLVLITLLAFATLVVAQKDWWETANFYQIYPRSFKDSDNDGIGDIRGIIEKLPYLKELGVTATWLSPILKSPQADFGYDIASFYDVDKIFGTNDDLKELFAEAKKLGIKIIMDFVPNHTSNEHEWFVKSVNRDSVYDNYYTWHNGKPNPNGGRNLPPNNWQAVFATRAWTWNEKRQQYYLHQFASGQPDLNYRNRAVVENMKDVLRYWMEQGADGFRIDAINHLMEVEDLSDEPTTGWTDDPTNYGYTHHIYTKDLQETYNIVREFRVLIDDFNRNNPGSTRVLFTEAYANITFTMKYYQDNTGNPIAHFPFNFKLIENLNEYSNAIQYKMEIDDWFNNLPSPDKTSNWVLSNHDKPRVGSRYGINRIDGMMSLLLLLPGVAVTYNGDELGMLDYRDGISWADTVDPQACNTNDPNNYKEPSRDPQRTPFQWDDSPNAGFCGATCKTWLPVHENYKTLNLKAQREAPKSFFKFYQQLSQLRTNAVFANGDFSSRAYNNDVFAFKRSYQGTSHAVLINFSNQEHTIDVNELNINFPTQSEVVVAGSRSNYNAGDVVPTSTFILKPYNTVVLKARGSGNEDTTTPSQSTSSDGSTLSSSSQQPSTSTPSPVTTTTPGKASTTIGSIVLLISALIVNHFMF